MFIHVVFDVFNIYFLGEDGRVQVFLKSVDSFVILKRNGLNFVFIRNFVEGHPLTSDSSIHLALRKQKGTLDPKLEYSSIISLFRLLRSCSFLLFNSFLKTNSTRYF